MRKKLKLNQNILERKWEETIHVIVVQKEIQTLLWEDFKI